MSNLRNTLVCLQTLLLFGCGAAVPEDQDMADPAVAEQVELEPTGPGSVGKSSKFPLKGETVVFYNVENLYDTEDDPLIDDADFLPTSAMQWTPERLTTKLKHLAEAIGMTGKELPVLIGLSEVENRGVVDRLANETSLKAAHYSLSHVDSPDERGIDVALLYDADVFSLVRSEALNVPLHEDRTRDILHTELTAGGHTFHIFVDHWPSRREGQAKSEPKRMAAAGVLHKAVGSIKTSPTTHILIMGDFNDTPTDRSIQEGLGAECTTTSKKLIDLMCIDQPKGSGSHLYDGKWDYLDQFIVDPSLIHEVEKAGALKDDRLLFNHPKYGPSPDKTYSGGKYKGGYSDHLPIVLRFK